MVGDDDERNECEELSANLKVMTEFVVLSRSRFISRPLSCLSPLEEECSPDPLIG